MDFVEDITHWEEGEAKQKEEEKNEDMMRQRAKTGDKVMFICAFEDSAIDL
jgi:hypothetical protein